MYTVVLVIHTLIALALIGMILVQRSSTDGFGMSGNSSNSMLSGRSQANLLTRITAILAACFIGTSLTLGIIVSHQRTRDSIGDKVAESAAAPVASTTTEGAPAAATDTAKPAEKAAEKPAAPAVPQSE